MRNDGVPPPVLWVSGIDRPWAGAVEEAGWPLVHVAVATGTRPFMAIVDAPSEAIALIRASGDGATLPILGIATATSEQVDRRIDATLVWPRDAGKLRPTIAQWCPVTRADVHDRLRARFGGAEIAALLDAFRALLIEATASSDARRDLAHRVAGIAGTLGFDDVGAAWLRLSEGDADAAPVADRAARRAIAALGG